MTNELQTLDIMQIQKLLPHSYPFLLLDKVIECRSGSSLTAIKNVTINEPIFTGHFEHRPIFPGVLMIECIAQASALLASLILDATANRQRLYLFAGVDHVRFKRIVEPGDQMCIEVELKNHKQRVWRCAGTITVEDELACNAEILFTHKDLV